MRAGARARGGGAVGLKKRATRGLRLWHRVGARDDDDGDDDDDDDDDDHRRPAGENIDGRRFRADRNLDPDSELDAEAGRTHQVESRSEVQGWDQQFRWAQSQDGERAGCSGMSASTEAASHLMTLDLGHSCPTGARLAVSRQTSPRCVEADSDHCLGERSRSVFASGVETRAPEAIDSPHTWSDCWQTRQEQGCGLGSEHPQADCRERFEGRGSLLAPAHQQGGASDRVSLSNPHGWRDKLASSQAQQHGPGDASGDYPQARAPSPRLHPARRYPPEAHCQREHLHRGDQHHHASGSRLAPGVDSDSNSRLLARSGPAQTKLIQRPVLRLLRPGLRGDIYPYDGEDEEAGCQGGGGVANIVPRSERGRHADDSYAIAQGLGGLDHATLSRIEADADQASTPTPFTSEPGSDPSEPPDSDVE
eukprot:2797006-Rhodomonas_salina.1